MELLCGDDGWGNRPSSDGCYGSVERFEFHGNEDGERKRGLYRRGVASRTEVLLLPVFKATGAPALLTTWKMVIKYIDVFFVGNNSRVVDPAVTWCLYYHHNGILHFIRNRKYA